jgi:hypothetical protein
MAVLGMAACAHAAAPPAPVRSPKLWTGTIEAHKGLVFGLALSDDGETLVTTCDQKVALWDLRTGKLIRERSMQYARQVTFVSQGKEIACECRELIHILERQSLKTRAVLDKVGHYGVNLHDASQDGAYVVGSDGRTLAVWDVAKRKLLWHKVSDEKCFLVHRVAFSPDGKVLAVSLRSARDLVRLLDARTGRELRGIPYHESGMATHLAFTAEGSSLVTGYPAESYFEVWDVNTGKLVRRVEWESKEPWVRAIALSPDGKTLAVADKDRLRLYEVATWGLRHTVDLKARRLVLCPRGRVVWTDPEGTGQIHVSTWRGLEKAKRLTKEDSARLWDDLGSKDAAVAHKAAEALLASPEQAAELLARLPRADLTRKKLDRLVANLDDDDFDVREGASDELKAAGHLADAALREGLAKGPSAEGKRRIGKLLTAIDPVSPQRLRSLRAVEILEGVASPEALKQLQRLAEQAEDARAALARLRRLPK